MSKKLRANLVLLAITPILNGCMLAGLSEDLAWLDSASRVSGTVSGAQSATNPIVVALVRAGDHHDYIPETYTVRYGDGEFSLLNRNGEFYLMAFEDKNEDLRFQPGEAVGWWGEPSLLNLDAEQTQDTSDKNIRLRSAQNALQELPEIYAPQRPPIVIARDTINLGEVVDLEDPRFADEVGALGMWEPVKHVQAGNSGLYFLEPYDADKLPVLFVHGITGTGRVWRRLVAKLDRDKYQPWILNYPSGASLNLLAESINGLINELQVSLGFTKMGVVAHSMGGLLARDLVNRNLAQPGRSSVVSFIAISTPWGGHAAAQRATNAPISVPAWRDMAPDGDYIRSIMAKPLPPNVPFDLLFGFEGSSLFFSGNSDGTIALSSLLAPQAQAQARQIRAFAEDHVSILKSQEVADTLNQLLEAHWVQPKR